MTREEWKDWAEVMAAKERPKPDLSFLSGLRNVAPEQMQFLSVGYRLGGCSCGCHQREQGGLMGGLFGNWAWY